MSGLGRSMGAVLTLLLVLTCGLAPAAAGAQTRVEYIHTDLLGNVAVITDANANAIERREYEPYGAQLTPVVQDGPGYTGHVQDAATGLVYMQQRYYDAEWGVFLSVDPVTAYGNGDMRHFNRYAYAFNSPYSFTDPDGRAPGDNWYGYNDQRFRDWVHGEKQAEGRRGAQNYTKRDLDRLFREWKDLGEPRGKGGTSGRGGSQRGFFVPSWLLKLNVVLSLATYSSDLNAGEQEIIDRRMREAEGAQGSSSGRSDPNDGGGHLNRRPRRQWNKGRHLRFRNRGGKGEIGARNGFSDFSHRYGVRRQE